MTITIRKENTWLNKEGSSVALNKTSSKFNAPGASKRTDNVINGNNLAKS